jgi:hypothetical protein
MQAEANVSCAFFMIFSGFEDDCPNMFVSNTKFPNA